MTSLSCTVGSLSNWSIVAYSQPLFGSALLKCDSDKGAAAAIPGLRLKAVAGHCLNVFLYVRDQQPIGGQPSQPCEKGLCQQFIMRSGSARVPIEELFQKTAKFKFLDIEGNDVAACEALLTVGSHDDGDDDDEQFHSAAGKQLPSTLGLLELTRQAFATQLPSSIIMTGTNVHKSLPTFDFYQVQQHFGPIPMWAFPLLNLTLSPGADCTKYVENALSNAMFLLGIDRIDPRNKAELAELLSEMQTLALRAQLYVLDYTRVNSGGEYKQVDKWENPLVSPNPLLMSYDCEDATVRIMQEGVWLRSCRASSRLLEPVLQAEEAYFTFMVGMTLKLSPDSRDDKWCYHAAVLKLDKQYVRWKLFPNEFKEPDANERWPAVLLEGTNYTTGCWDYKCRFANADKLSERSYTDTPVETIPKITPGLMRKKGLYGVVQSLFSHELARTFGIVQIELAQNGRRAALASSVMQYDKQVDWFPLRIDKKKTKFLDTIDTLYKEAYPLIQPPAFTREVTPIVQRRPSPDIDCLVRSVDFFQAGVSVALAKEFNKSKITSRVLWISDDLQVVHVSA